MDPQLVDHMALRKEIRDHKRSRERGPDYQPRGERIWVAYAWSRKYQSWLLVGFQRGARLNTRRLARFRKRARIPMDVIIKYIDLLDAYRTGGPTSPPVRYHTSRPDVPGYIVLHGRLTSPMDLAASPHD